MKKSYLMIAAAAAIFAACSSNDTFKEVNEEVEIGFSEAGIENQTKAALTQDWFNTSGKKFGVFGYKGDLQIFDNEEVTSTGTDWTHTTKRFWDKAATNYKFYAYAPYASTAPTFSTTTGFTFTGDIIADIDATDADKAIALKAPTSYTQCCGNHGSHVPFVFSHVLSKLSFKAKISSAADALATVVIKSIDLDFPTATAPTWTQTAIGAVDGTTSFGTYTPKDGTNYETSVFNNSSNTTALTTSGAAIGKTFIVYPVNSESPVSVPSHIFGIKVTYDLTYKSDNKVESGCIATGVIGDGTPSTNLYQPGQNDYYVVTITVDPAQVDFCVEGVNEWDPTNGTGRDIDVK